MDARALIDGLRDERPRFVRLARGRVATEADAEDVVQRALARAVERAPQLADEGSARAWFYRILRRAIVDHHRTKSRTIGLEAAEAVAAPEDEQLRGPVCPCAQRLLAELRPAYADILRRVDLEGEEAEAASRALGVTMSAFYVRLHRARRALRARVEGHCGVSSVASCLECTCCESGRCGE